MTKEQLQEKLEELKAQNKAQAKRTSELEDYVTELMFEKNVSSRDNDDLNVRIRAAKRQLSTQEALIKSLMRYHLED